MNHNPLLLFIRDMWQTVLFFCIGYALIVATILLSFRTLVRQMRIPEQFGHRFRKISAGHSGIKRPLNPKNSSHPFR